MSESVQSLLDRIHDESISKTQQECTGLTNKAQEEATQIIARAKEEAASMIANAQKEVALSISKGEESLKQAARDTLLSLREEMEKRLSAVVLAAAQEATQSSKILAELLLDVIRGYLANHGDENCLEVLLPADKLASLETLIMAGLTENLKKQVNLTPSASLKYGFKLVFTNNSVAYDFSDEALAEALSEYLNPKLAALLANAGK